jgi:hypothetical protein
MEGLKKISKFTESAWKLSYYSTSVFLAIRISYGEPWFGNTDAFWHGWPHQTLKYVSPYFLSISFAGYLLEQRIKGELSWFVLSFSYYF